MTQASLSVDILWQLNGQRARAAFTLDAQVTALIGPSGAGKTTLARMISGLEAPAGGTIRFGEEIFCNVNKRRLMKAEERNIGYVMQDAALFPHMSVEANIAFSPKSTPQSVTEAISLMSLGGLTKRRPETLSGGERRRVAIARALAAQPALLILDEPMNGLDPKARADLLPRLKALAAETKTPVLMITHLLEDMLAVADAAILMAPGKVVASGSLEDILSAPECSDLLGLDDAGQLLEASIEGEKDGLLVAAIADNEQLLIPNRGEATGSRVTLRILASDIAISLNSVKDISVLNQLPCKVSNIEMNEHNALISLELSSSGTSLKSRITRSSQERLGLKAGMQVHALIKAVSVRDIVA